MRVLQRIIISVAAIGLMATLSLYGQRVDWRAYANSIAADVRTAFAASKDDQAPRKDVEPPPPHDVVRSPSPAEEPDPTANLSFDEAVKDGHVEQVRRLLDNNPWLLDKPFDRSVRSDWTPLMWALLNCNDTGCADVAKLLISRGANVNHADEVGDTPLHFAVSCDSADLVYVLLKRGANVNARNTNWNHTPLKLALEKRNDEIAYILRQNGGRE